ncbi:MAG: STAS domain-containing protein [Phycisphaerales bacterium]|jgi:anti-anti-sigma factor
MSLVSSTHVQAEMHNGVLVAKLTCEKIDRYEVDAIRTDLLELVGKLNGKLALNFGDVTMVAPMGLGLLTDLYKACAAKKGRLVLFNVNKDLVKLLKMTPVWSSIYIKSDQESAIRAAS